MQYAFIQRKRYCQWHHRLKSLFVLTESQGNAVISTLQSKHLLKFLLAKTKCIAFKGDYIKK